MRIAYLTGRYPEISHTFVMREIHALRRLGVEVQTLSIWRTDPTQLLTAADRQEAADTYALLPPDWREVASSMVRASLGRGAAMGSTLAQALRLCRPGMRGRVLGILWFLEAVVLWHRCHSSGVRHVHAHLNGTAPTVALLTTHLGNHGSDSHEWTWSFTVHGPTEFYDTAGEHLGDKVRAADLVVAISDYARSQLMAQVEERWWSKIHVVHCGVEPAVFAPGPERAPTDGPLHVLNVSRIAPTKGNAMLLHALAELERRGIEMTATVVGDGPGADRLRDLVSTLGLADRVELAGSVGQDMITSHYRHADVFCLPSFAEGVPVVLMEAMAMEIPVVATKIMGVGELVEDGVNGLLVPPGRVDALADALEALARAPERRREMGRRGRERVQAEFDIDKSARRLHRAFERVLCKHGNASFAQAPGAGDPLERVA